MSVDKDLFKLISENQIDVYRNKDDEVVEILLFVDHSDMEDLLTKSYKNYLNSLDDVKKIVLQDTYMVIDVFDYIDEWLEHGIEIYIDQGHINNYIKHERK